MKISGITAYKPAFGTVKKEARTALENAGVSADVIDKLHEDKVLTVKVGDDGLVRATFDKTSSKYWAYEWLADDDIYLNLLRKNTKCTVADMLANCLDDVEKKLVLGEAEVDRRWDERMNNNGSSGDETALQELANAGRI